jgi:hypothetical protein
VSKNLKQFVLDADTKIYVQLLHSFLLPSDSILEFNNDGCTSSCLFNDIIIHEGSPQHTVIADESQACELNIKSTNSNIHLHSASKSLTATVLVMGYDAPLEVKEKVLELCSTLEKLRLVVLDTDNESLDFIQKVNSLLTIRDFHVHVAGKYTVYVHNKKPEKVTRIRKTPQPIQVVLAVIAIFLLIVGYLLVRKLFF